jgi:hypothetical protein
MRVPTDLSNESSLFERRRIEDRRGYGGAIPVLWRNGLLSCFWTRFNAARLRSERCYRALKVVSHRICLLRIESYYGDSLVHRSELMREFNDDKSFSIEVPFYCTFGLRLHSAGDIFFFRIFSHVEGRASDDLPKNYWEYINPVAFPTTDASAYKG